MMRVRFAETPVMPKTCSCTFILVLALLANLLGLSSPAFGQEEIVLAEDEVGLVGYGSLINRESMERTLRRPFNGVVREVKLQGWKRSWDVAAPNKGYFHVESPEGPVVPDKIAYLNIRKQPGTKMNAVMFVIKKSELEGFHKREFIMDAVEVSKDLQGVKVQGGPVYAYVAKSEYLIKPGEKFPQVIVRSTYVDMVQKALTQAGPSFAKEFEESTDPLPMPPSLDVARPRDAAATAAKAVVSSVPVQVPMGNSGDCHSIAEKMVKGMSAL